ncbi:hypothetical protein GCM10023189_17260 [Nibrella saemangeumensis]|uniref:Uncharacterized protein n=1 Tax=Nibrella saemangeumensis TaxID=1084526 RepID=A0ABP8MQV0_9BACT
MSKKKANPDENDKPKVHKELEGFDIQINSFGEITTSFEIDKINQFLNKTVDDKKLRHRKDIVGRDDAGENQEDEAATESEEEEENFDDEIDDVNFKDE